MRIKWEHPCKHVYSIYQNVYLIMVAVGVSAPWSNWKIMKDFHLHPQHWRLLYKSCSWKYIAILRFSNVWVNRVPLSHLQTLTFHSSLPFFLTLSQEHIWRWDRRALGTPVWPEKWAEWDGWRKEFLGWPTHTPLVPSHTLPFLGSERLWCLKTEQA